MLVNHTSARARGMTMDNGEISNRGGAAATPRDRNACRNARIVFVMPRCRHDHIRAVHKQAWSLAHAGHEVVLVVKEGFVDEYLGMRVVVANAPFASVFRPLLNLPSLFLQAWRLRGDVYILRNPDTIPLAFVLRLCGREVIYDTHEDFSRRPLIHKSLPVWSRRPVAWLITRLERWLARTASGVIVTQAQQIQGLGGRTLLQPNAPLITGPVVEPALLSETPGRGEELSFIYVGEITRDRGIFTMLNMIQRVNHEIPARLDLVGWIRSAELRRRVMDHPGWEFVRFHGAVSHAESLSYIRRSDIGLALLQPVADYPTSSITKLFEYMQFGIPFIASDFPAWRVETTLGPAGFYVNPDSAEELATAAMRLATDAELRQRLGESGACYIATDFNWERLAKPFLDLVNSSLRLERVRAGR